MASLSPAPVFPSMSSMVLSRMDTATNASSSTPHRQGSGRTPSKSPTVGTSSPEPLPAGIAGTGGMTPAAAEALATESYAESYAAS